jgi:CRISPR-associated endonuclease Csn1
MLTWGIDIGTTSVGFAVLDFDPSRGEGRIRRMGVRIFPEGRTEDKKEPRNKQRREKRLIRRQFRRRKLRRRQLNESLGELGFLPAFGTAEWEKLMLVCPYNLRDRALTERLDTFEVGRALYHLSKRRHFGGRSLGDEKVPDKDELEGKQQADSLMGNLKGRTVGQYLASITEGRRRGHHAHRELVEQEFAAIIAAQAVHHEVLRKPETVAKLEHIIFFQRRTFWRMGTLGKCPLIPDAPLAPKGDWHAQQHVVLEQVTKLRVGGNQRPLTLQEQQAVLEAIDGKQSMNWVSVRKALKPIWKETGEPDGQKFNLEIGTPEKGIKGNITEAKLASLIGKAWATHPFQQEMRDTIHAELFAADYARNGNRIEILRPKEQAEQRALMVQKLAARWGLTPEQQDGLAKLELPGAWMRLSMQAILAMRPELESGTGVGQLLNSPDYESWRRETFPRRDMPTGEVNDKLPSHPKEMPQVRNPTVTRCLNELRKVTNNLIELYGKPDLIRVELAREVGLSPQKRADIFKDNQSNERMRKRAVEDLQAHGRAEPSGKEIEKWLLWKECDGKCPYTGLHIGFDALFGKGDFEVEHIWPRSRSLNNSMSNKTLCAKAVNIEKDNRTPFEMWGHDPEKWKELQERLEELKLPPAKIRRFLNQNVEKEMGEEWCERQLRDTSYAAREARDFLARLWPDDGKPRPVETVNGRVTAELRRRWGLNELLGDDGKKNRADHRHHAVDALVCALSSRAYVKRLSDYFKTEYTAPDAYVPKPWKSLREDAAKILPHVVVSHRVSRKVSGPLHKETTWGYTEEKDNKKASKAFKFVTRKKLTSLTDGEIEAIRDDHIRQLVTDHVAANGGKAAKAFATHLMLPSRQGRVSPPIKKVRLTKPFQMQVMIPLGRKGYAMQDGNHHIAIFRKPDGGAEFEVVSVYEAHMRLSRKQPVVNRQREGCSFVMSLSIGETVLFPKGHEKEGYRVVKKMSSSGQVTFAAVNDALREEVWAPGINTILETGARKISVDPIGRIRPAHD